MCQLLETIKIKRNQLQQLIYHNHRVNYSRSALFQFGDTWDLKEIIKLPVLNPEITYRCRFLYSTVVEQVEFIPYAPRIIQKLFLVCADELAYNFKFANRSALENLKEKHATENNSDILIVKNGLVTDVSYAPLLKGTKRALYLERGILTEKKITPADLPKYQKARLINAMIDLETGNDITIDNIHRKM
jgi:4-amino-4-deoxychorismate lyase